jgi:hypothetical protein
METRRWQTRIFVAATHTTGDDGRHSYLDTQRNKRIASFYNYPDIAIIRRERESPSHLLSVYY